MNSEVRSHCGPFWVGWNWEFGGFLSHGGTPRRSSKSWMTLNFRIETYGDLGVLHFQIPPYGALNIKQCGWDGIAMEIEQTLVSANLVFQPIQWWRSCMTMVLFRGWLNHQPDSDRFRLNHPGKRLCFLNYSIPLLGAMTLSSSQSNRNTGASKLGTLFFPLLFRHNIDQIRGMLCVPTWVRWRYYHHGCGADPQWPKD